MVLQVQRFDDGERQRYFADDKQQLRDLVAQQRYEGAADIDANLADNIMRKGKRFRWVWIHSFIHGWMNGWTDGQTDGLTD